MSTTVFSIRGLMLDKSRAKWDNYIHNINIKNDLADWTNDEKGGILLLQRLIVTAL